MNGPLYVLHSLLLYFDATMEPTIPFPADRP